MCGPAFVYRSSYRCSALDRRQCVRFRLKTLTNTEASDWVHSVGLNTDAGPRVCLPNNSRYVFTVRWPKILPYQVSHFANLFLPPEPTDVLFWLADNGASGA